MDTNRTWSPDAPSTDAAVSPSTKQLPFVSSEVERPVSSSIERPVSSEVEKRIGRIEGHLPDLVDPLTPSEPENAFTETRYLRHDGWTPERKRLFLSRLAECGVIVEACEAAGMSARSAYNLRDRDPLFAAGWDAANVKARQPLADEAYSRARNGVVERIYKDGVVVAERHRYDNRLTMAVLARLDARIDRAEEKGAAHLAVAARWNEYLAALAEDRREDGMALLETAPAATPAANAGHRELHELRDGEDPEMDHPADVDRHIVWDEDGTYWTDYPPPPGFDGEEQGAFRDRDYRRTLSPAEQAVVDADAADYAARCAARRDAYFGFSPEPDSGGEDDRCALEEGAGGGDPEKPPPTFSACRAMTRTSEPPGACAP
jgi:hypothetical protein